MGELIPLFPLGTPLFPGIVLPLQIFEPRYRRLMRDLLTLPEGGDRRFFGVVAIRQGWEVQHIAPAEALSDVGCTARVQAVRPQADGGFRIVTVGGERFRLLDVVVADDPPYLQGEAEWLAEEGAAEGAGGDTGGGVGPAAGEVTPPCDEGLDHVVASVARASLDVLSHGVCDLFTRYGAEVSGLGSGGADDAEPTGAAAGGGTARSAAQLPPRTPRRPSCWTASVTTRPHCATCCPYLIPSRRGSLR